MIRGTLLLCAVILASVFYGCAPPPAPRLAIAAGCDIGAIVSELKPGFSPAGYGACIDKNACTFLGPQHYVPTHPSGNFANEKAAISAAYAVAPPFFQASLCSLHAIYIDTDTAQNKASAWGMRERLYPHPFPDHIGISAAALTLLASSQSPYATYEKNVLDSLLNLPPPQSFLESHRRRRAGASWVDEITFIASPDPVVTPLLTPAQTAIPVLGILAHEMGHILWLDQIIDPSGSPVTNDPTPTPATDHFSAISWGAREHTRGFHAFGESNDYADPTRPPAIGNVLQDLHASCTSCAADHLNKIYSGEWASLFATVAPVEDFAETYKLMVLTGNSGGPLQSLSISVPGTNGSLPYSKDILYNLNNSQSILNTKMKAIVRALGLP